MNGLRIFTVAAAVVSIIINVAWAIRPVNRRYAEKIIAPITLGILVIVFEVMVWSKLFRVDVLNGYSAGLHIATQLILILFGIFREDVKNGNSNNH